MDLDSLQKLYVHELKDLYSAENQILDTLPKLVKKAGDSGLKDALKSHERETRTHVERLEGLFRNLEFKPGGHKCKGMEGLLKEGDEMLQDVDDDEVRDAAIISACQRVEHYEIAAYGVARAYAKQLGRHDDAEMLTTTLDEEGAADRKLTQLAERRINFAASR